MRIEEVSKMKKAIRDSVIAMIKCYVAQNTNKRKIPFSKEVLAVTMYRFQNVQEN